MSIESTFNNEKIRHLHRSPSTKVTEGTPLAQVIQRMRSEKSGVALVVNKEDRLTGIFTERDVLMKVLGKTIDSQMPIEKIMTHHPLHLGYDDSVGDAVRLMVENKVRHVPLVDAKNRVEGQVNILNIVQFLVEHFPSEIYNLPPNPDQHLNSSEGA